MGSIALLPLRGFFYLLYLGVLLVSVAALIDCARRPERAFAVAGKQTKKFWLVILAVATLTALTRIFIVIGLIAAIVYLVDVRPAVRGGHADDRW